ncbi:hypothetical protein CRYUN_Cryun27aG0084300 [Craigia yunnanensis]
MLRSTDMLKGVHKTCQRKTSAPLPLTEAQLKSIFKRFDTNGDGRLSKQELRDAFASLGSYLPGWRAGRGLYQANGNGDGYVSDDELDDLVKYALKCGYTKYNPASRKRPEYQDQLLNAGELKRAFSQLDKPQISSFRVNQTLRKVDRYGDKCIDSNELPDLVKFASSILP